MKNKSDVFGIFKIFHDMVKRETLKTLKCLRSDNDGQYCSNKFVEYCSKYGIRHENTGPHTPQHNIVAERKTCYLRQSCLRVFRLKP